MEEYTTYGVKILHYNPVFRRTTEIYREAVDFFIHVCLMEWDCLSSLSGLKKNNEVEKLTVITRRRPAVPYDFSARFYKFPSYYRRAAIAEAIGKVSSYKSSQERWEKEGKGKPPGVPRAGRVYPALYRKNTYLRTGDYSAEIKVYIRNTWDWLKVSLKRSDVEYIQRHCSKRKECVPTLQKRGKEWYLDFTFAEKTVLNEHPLCGRTILSVDLGISQACVCTGMRPDGTVTGRGFLSLPVEKDCLEHAIGRIKKAQKHGAAKVPRLWAVAKGINDRIGVKTAAFIMEKALEYHADVIVFEYLELGGKKRGSKKQRLHLWKARYVQKMVAGKAHRAGIRVSHVNARGTSAYAFDGSGRTDRKESGNYSISRFPNGKIYHSDLNAAYNIGARYFIREHIKSLPERERLGIAAKVPECTRRRTCTLSVLINLYAVLTA